MKTNPRLIVDKSVSFERLKCYYLIEYIVGEWQVSLTTPPIKASKRPREDSEVVRIKDDTSERMQVFTFRVLLPNGTSVGLKMSEQRNEIPIEKFIDMVKKENDLLINRQKRRIIWEYQDLYFTNAFSNKIRIKVDFREFTPIECNLLWLHVRFYPQFILVVILFSVMALWFVCLFLGVGWISWG